MSNGAAWSPRLTRLNDLLAELYPDMEAARQVVRKAGLPAASIKFHPASGINWFNILEDAQRRNRVDAIVDVARADFPERDEWAELAPGITDRADRRGAPAAARESGRLFGSESRRKLYEALLSAFPSRNDLNALLLLEMNQPLEVIAAGNLAESVLRVIQWAEAQGRLDELISAAARRNPGNPELAAFVAGWRP